MTPQEALLFLMPDFHYTFEGSYPKTYEAWKVLEDFIFKKEENKTTDNNGE